MSLSVLSWFHPLLNTEEIKSNTIWPKLLKNEIFFSLLFSSSLLLIKSEIYMREILMLLTSISWMLFCLNIEIGLVWPSHNLRLPGWSSIYGKKEMPLLIAVSRSLTVDFILFSLFIFILLFFSFSFSLSIFRTTRVRAYQSRCHISHKLMA